MNNRKFIKQLRKDNIDLSLLRSELGQLDRQRRRKTWKEQLLHVLRSNPVQFVLCALVLIDAVIVIAEIILEIHSEKSTKEAYEDLLKESRDFLNKTFGCLGSEGSYEELSLIDQMTTLMEATHRGGCPESVNVSTRSVASPASANVAAVASYQGSAISYAASAAASVSNGPRASQTEKNNKQKMAKTLHHVSEVLHYASIAILSLFVLEVFAKVLCLGKTFFKEKFEVVDAVVILTSFVADIVFVYVALSEVSVMVIVLLWRIVRVINGLMMHEKQRDEFRIQLQKRARRMSEMKVEGLEIGKEMQDKHISALEELCREMGASDDQIKKCKPRYMNHTSLQTNNALKSMAAMTTGFLSGLVRAQPSNTALSRLNHFAESPRTLHPLQTIHELPGGSKAGQPTAARLRPTGGPSPSPSPTLNGKPAGPSAQLLWRDKRPSNEAAGPSNGAGPKEEKACSSRSLLAPPPPQPPPPPPQSSSIDGPDGSPGHRIVRTGEEKRKLLAQDTVSTSSCASSTSSSSSSFDDEDGPWKIRLDSKEAKAAST